MSDPTEEMSHPSPMPTPVMTTNRLEAFSDGVFAIVITLLVLDLKLPAGQGGLGHRLWLIWPKMSAYAITFVIVGIYWVGHHGVFHVIKRIDKTVMWLNLGLLMAISFMPFPASIMGLNPQDPVAIRFYVGTLILIGLGFIAIWTYASRGDRLIIHLDPYARRILWQRCLMAPCIYVAAFLASWIHPWLSLGLLPLVPLIYIPPNRFDPRHFKA